MATTTTGDDEDAADDDAVMIFSSVTFTCPRSGLLAFSTNSM